MIIIEVIYSILCAVLPCTIYFTARKRKGYHLSILAMLIFVLYLWKVYDLTGAGGLTNIFYAPKGEIIHQLFKLILISSLLKS